jgi:hypothetical protein
LNSEGREEKHFWLGPEGLKDITEELQTTAALPVHFSAMTDIDNKYQQSIFMDFINIPLVDSR